MRYHLESTLPIHAFQPVGGRHSPFKHGMTLEGGGGGIISSVTDSISDALGTSGSGGGILGGLAEFDKGVSNVIPGGWGTIGTAVATYFGGPLGAAAAQGIEGAVKGEDWDKTLKDMAIATAAAYASQGIAEGLSSGAEAAPVTDYSTLSDAAMQESLEQSIKLPTEVPYVDMADKGTLLTPDSAYPTPYVPDEASPYIDGTPPSYPDSSYEGSPYVDGVPPEAIPPELNLNVPYQDLPDGAVQLGYNAPAPEILASSTPASALEEELKKEAFFKELINNPKSTYTPEGVQFYDQNAPADVATQKMVETGMLDRLGQLPGTTYDMAKSYVVNNPYTSAALGLGALTLMGSGQQPSPAPVEVQSTTSRGYTGGYGSSGGIPNQYLLRNRITSENVYDYENPYDRYATVNRRYAKGGEVKHFAFGGISNALTRAFQPVEKAVLQPIGRAAPFIREVAPYAGLIAAPFITSPIAAAGIGGLSSGFGRPGSGFDMKRALMGGIAAYGASTLGAGLEAAGTTPTNVSSAVPNFDADITASVQRPLTETVSKPFFRSPEVVGKGIGNLLSPSTYDQAAANFGTQAGIYKTGVPLVIGTSGMMAVDEAQKMREEADIAAAASKGESQEMLARIAKGKKRAEEAVRSNPYMYAIGGTVQDVKNKIDAQLTAPQAASPALPANYQEARNAFQQQQEAEAQRQIASGQLGPGKLTVVGNDQFGQQFGYAADADAFNQFYNKNYANPVQTGDLPVQNISKDALNNPLPPGFIPPSGPSTQALEDFYNPKTGQKVTVGSGGYTPPSDFYNVTGLPANRYPSQTVRPPDASTGYRPPLIPQNQFLIERMLNSRNIYSQPPMRMQPRPTSGLSALIQRQRFMPRRGFAMGGSIDDELGGDYSAMGMDQGNMQKGLFGMGYAAGGTPRFLSGGGDGMSDSIPATIGGTQEARLADGEFVIPADVVSHLGNGSSKAGAKQLYSMMDRVRKARTGNKKQGRQINPKKLMPA